MSEPKQANGNWGNLPARERICVALDVPSQNEALRLAESLREELLWFKVGAQLFGAAGPDVVRKLKELGVKVFLDLKYHDIPNTVGSAVMAGVSLGVDMLNVHTLGGSQMMAAAAKAARTGNGTRPLVVGVTVLTSMSQDTLSDELRVSAWLRAYVMHLTRMAMTAGLDGVVASGEEASRIRLELGDGPWVVTPGIRLAAAGHDDQKRVLTPAAAIRFGASMLVIGRPIIQADDPVLAARKVIGELEEATASS